MQLAKFAVKAGDFFNLFCLTEVGQMGDKIIIQGAEKLCFSP
jgi:hypothetical protein